jgi:hypothetical protein
VDFAVAIWQDKLGSGKENEGYHAKRLKITVNLFLNITENHDVQK